MSELKKMVIISGYAGSGKDTVAAYLRDKLNLKMSTGLPQWEVFALADAVRDTASVIFNLDYGVQDQYLYDPEYKNEKIPGYKYSGREMCQIIGNEMRELFHSEVWCDNLYSRILEWEPINAIISDNRYPNEVKYFEDKFDVTTLRIDRPEKDGNVGISNHPSEANVIPTEFTIVNDGTLEQLYAKVDKFIEDLIN
jgi:hypothetical protein